MKNVPMISIIMNCYNSDAFLKKAIDSVYAQTFKDWEIIFWDNVSTDNSALIAKSYDEKLKYYCAKENTQLGEARNMALKKSTGKYICFLDCDDLYLKDKLLNQYDLMENEDYAMCYGSTTIIDEKGENVRKEVAHYSSGKLFGYLLNRYDIKMVSVMIRRDILENNNLSFASQLQYCPDHNLFMEIASRYNVGVLSKFIAVYRVQANSLSRKTLHLVSKEIKYTLDKISERDRTIELTYPAELKSAYLKLNYYDAVNYIYLNKYVEASRLVKKIFKFKWEYRVLYILLYLRVPNKFLLRLLNR